MNEAQLKPEIHYINKQRRLEDYVARTGSEFERHKEGFCPATNIHIPSPRLRIDKYAEQLFERANELYDILTRERCAPYVFELGLCDQQTWTISGPRNKNEQHSIEAAKYGTRFSGDIINYISLVGHERVSREQKEDSFLINLGERKTLEALRQARERKRCEN